MGHSASYVPGAWRSTPAAPNSTGLGCLFSRTLVYSRGAPLMPLLVLPHGAVQIFPYQHPPAKYFGMVGAAYNPTPVPHDESRLGVQ